MSPTNLSPRQSVDSDGNFPVATGDQSSPVEQARGHSDCPTDGCEFEAGHEGDHPCGQHLIDGEPCPFCGKPNPCDDCWTPATHAVLKGLAAEAGKDVEIR